MMLGMHVCKQAALRSSTAALLLFHDGLKADDLRDYEQNQNPKW